MKLFVCFALIAVAAASPLRVTRGVIHQEEHQSEGDSVGSSAFHHEVEHEHAKSHQSVKLEHFHPVPVFVKKEHAHLLKHPLEKGKSEHGIKLLHPKTEHHHGYGLVLEEHRSDHHGDHGHDHGFSEHSDDIGQIEHIQEEDHKGYEGYKGGYEGGFGEGSEQAHFDIKGLQEESHFQFQPIDLSHLGQEEGHGYH